jgi:hypothetical protein
LSSDQEIQRQENILHLQRIDANGVWSDEGNKAEGYEPMAYLETVSALKEIYERE